jgi:hypothetical protein
LAGYTARASPPSSHSKAAGPVRSGTIGALPLIGDKLGDVKEAAERYTRTPLLKRLPSVGSLVLALALARVISPSLWAQLAIFVGSFFLCVFILHVVFRQPLERLILYREYSDD